MTARKRLCMHFVAGLALPAAAFAQAVAPTVPVPSVVSPAVPSATKPAAPSAVAPVTAIPSAPVPTTVAPPAPPPEPVLPPPPLWSVADAQELLGYIAGVERDGLEPRQYDPDGLARAIAGGDPTLLSLAATERFNKLSSDLALGNVRSDEREQWHVVDRDLDKLRQRTLLIDAVVYHRVRSTLDSLLPTHPQYGALRHSLELAKSAGSDSTAINRIRLNLDRWRWLPRDLGRKYIIVNVPAFHATLVENGVTRWKHRAIAGATKTPTPQLSAMATGVIFNPWWEVPKSIEGEVRGKRGYVAVRGKDGKVQRWRQPPGPTNALGKVKFVMPNAQAIYLHDTNARSRFNSQVRALSHGCVRTEHILDLAGELLADDGGLWDQAKIDETLASRKTVEASFVKPVPVYIVYFSSAALLDGSIVNYADLYKRDGKVLAALLDDRAAAPKAEKKEVAAR